MPSGSPTGGGGALGGGAGGGGAAAPSPAYALSGFTAANYYQGVAGDMRGEVAGFAVSMVMRLLSMPAGQGSIVANQNIYQATGGWYLGVDSNRFKFGVAQASDSVIVDNFVGADLSFHRDRLLNRLFVLTMNYNGTGAECYVNGQLEYTLTPSGGYQQADVGQTPYFGRNTNAGSPLPPLTSGLVGAGYMASALTTDQVGDHVRACYTAGGFADDVGGGTPFTSAFLAPDSAVVPATISDAHGVAGDFTLNGALSSVPVAPIW